MSGHDGAFARVGVLTPTPMHRFGLPPLQRGWRSDARMALGRKDSIDHGRDICIARPDAWAPSMTRLTSRTDPRPDSGAPVSTETVEAVVRAARVFAAVTAESIAQAGEGVTLPQLRVLVLVAQEGTWSNAAVARALDIHISSASRLCDRLVQAGLLGRQHDPENRRRVELTLTPVGSRLVTAVTEHRRLAFTRILALMPAEQSQSLTSAMATFADAGERQLTASRSVGP